MVIQKAIVNLSKEIETMMKMILDDYKLSNSDLSRTISPYSKYGESSLVGIICNDYIEYINSGRKPGKFVPVDALIKWARKNGIPTDNHTIYAINYSIYKKGIKAKPVLDEYYDLIDTYWDNWSKELVDSILTIIDKYFEN